uniref:50S ribosomal protein L6 n=1 Tax=Thuricola similis TaxID=2784598 RepID=A0A7T8G530_9CILI|nr:50S ribosomal protein L6 [Thuricola similis]QQP22145.1 50S ribosomal protein L6 [Thuricola similis]
MIFITYNWRIISQKWIVFLYKNTLINFFIFTTNTYTPFKKKLPATKYSFTTDKFFYNFFDTYNQVSYCKNYIIKNHNMLWSQIKIIILIYWKRVVFKGKGFRMRKFKNSRKLTFNFGHSHWTKLRLRTFFIMFKRKRRQSQYFFCYYKLLFDQICLLIMNIRRINKYTKRGLRLKKQPIVRRFGKISQMLSAHNY